jgi:hypothetical protein
LSRVCACPHARPGTREPPGPSARVLPGCGGCGGLPGCGGLEPPGRGVRVLLLWAPPRANVRVLPGCGGSPTHVTSPSGPALNWADVRNTPSREPTPPDPAQGETNPSLITRTCWMPGAGWGGGARAGHAGGARTGHVGGGGTSWAGHVGGHVWVMCSSMVCGPGGYLGGRVRGWGWGEVVRCAAWLGCGKGLGGVKSQGSSQGSMQGSRKSHRHRTRRAFRCTTGGPAGRR